MNSFDINFERVIKELEHISTSFQQQIEELCFLRSKISSDSPTLKDRFDLEIKKYSVDIATSSSEIQRTFEKRFAILKKITSCCDTKSLSVVLPYTFIEGNPWNFFLKCRKESEEEIIDFEICRALENRNAFHTTPCEGEMVLVDCGAFKFRGSVLSILPNQKVEVLNIDDGGIFELRLNQLYKPPTYLLKKSPNVIFCSLNEFQDAQQFWRAEFNHLFVTLMSSCSLNVLNMRPISFSHPFKYEVDLIALFNSDVAVVFLTDWFQNTITPLLTNEKGNVNKLLGHFSELLDLVKDQSLATNEPSLASAEESSPFEFSSFLDAVSSDDQEVDSHSEMVKVSDDDHGEDNANFVEDTNVMNLEYGCVFNNEADVCKFSDNGTCWKQTSEDSLGCLKEHVQIGPGFQGAVYIYGRFTSHLSMPGQGDYVTLRPTHVAHGHIFYSHIEQKRYPAQVSLEILEQRMNNTEEYSRYANFDVEPENGELCVGLDSKNKWIRCRVLNCFENMVLVSSIDYGFNLTLPLKKLRRINDDLLHLPPQAIKCILFGIKGIEDKKVETMDYLSDLLLHKTYRALVIFSYPEDYTLEVSITLPETKRSIESELIHKGLCTISSA